MSTTTTRMIDANGQDINVGDTVMVIKRGWNDWTPEGFNAGEVVELDSAAWLMNDGHITIKFGNGENYCYMPNQTVKVLL